MSVHNDFMCDQQKLKIAPSVSWLGTDQQTGPSTQWNTG